MKKAIAVVAMSGGLSLASLGVGAGLAHADPFFDQGHGWHGGHGPFNPGHNKFLNPGHNPFVNPGHNPFVNPGHSPFANPGHNPFINPGHF
ncbi:hypothetical protein [Mycobacterium sp.]|uniref:hypothetical protein n=1 Tax=Mycobacterium sp. TaxID=1785 RepID=UPI003BAB09B2